MCLVPILFLKGLFTRLHLRPDKNRNHKDYVWDPIRTMALSFIPLFVLLHSNSFWKCCVIKEVHRIGHYYIGWAPLTTSWLKGSQCSGHCCIPFTVYQAYCRTFAVAVPGIAAQSLLLELGLSNSELPYHEQPLQNVRRHGKQWSRCGTHRVDRWGCWESDPHQSNIYGLS